MMKWRKVRNKTEWVCDVCRKCGDESCCEDSAPKWIKHLELTTNRERDALSAACWDVDAGPRQGLTVSDWGEEFALCSNCWDVWQPRTEKALQEALSMSSE